MTADWHVTFRFIKRDLMNYDVKFSNNMPQRKQALTLPQLRLSPQPSLIPSHSSATFALPSKEINNVA
jgi:hypothetical protein